MGGHLRAEDQDQSNVDQRKLGQRIAATEKNQVTEKEIFEKALDDLVSVNSLFTVAVFVGLSMASLGQSSLEGKQGCDAGPDVLRRLVVYEVVSFGCFLFSSLIAKSLKIYLNVYAPDEFDGIHTFGWDRAVAFLFSTLGSIVGIVLLTFSMTHIVQIKLGLLSCGSYHAVAAVATLSVLVAIGALLYMLTVSTAVWHIWSENKKQGNEDEGKKKWNETEDNKESSKC